MSEQEQQTRREEEALARLVRQAAPPEPVPAERVARALEATRAHWRKERRRRATRRWSVRVGLAAAAMILVTLTLRFAVAPPTAEDPAWGRVASLSGPLMRIDEGVDEEGRLLEVDDLLTSGTILATDARSRAAVVLASGASFRLDKETRLRLTPESRLVLVCGALYLDSGAAVHLPSVVTAYGEFEDLGTQYEVRRIGTGVRLRVREGRVRLASENDAESLVTEAGTELTLEQDGATRRRTIPRHGEEWAWVEGLASVYDIDGRTARVFLDWVARERGLQLAFADLPTATIANQTVLRGAIEGLSLDEALAVVLPTCQLEARQEDGRLVVSRWAEGSSAE